MHIHGSGEFTSDSHPDDPQLIDLDALDTGEESAEANIA
jgi:hypothetical protein